MTTKEKEIKTQQRLELKRALKLEKEKKLDNEFFSFNPGARVFGSTCGVFTQTPSSNYVSLKEVMESYEESLWAY